MEVISVAKGLTYTHNMLICHSLGSIQALYTALGRFVLGDNGGKVTKRVDA